MPNKLAVLALAALLVVLAAGLERCGYDPEVDMQALDERFDRVAQLYVDGDVDALMGEYTNKVPPVAFVADERLEGRDQIRQYWEEFFAGYDVTSLEFKDVAHRLERNMCCSYGLWEMTAMREGQEVEMSGRFSSLVGRADQGWHVVHEHISIPYEEPEASEDTDPETDATAEM
jgi:ketosteroid isomerase-like protein